MSEPTPKQQPKTEASAQPQGPEEITHLSLEDWQKLTHHWPQQELMLRAWRDDLLHQISSFVEDPTDPEGSKSRLTMAKNMALTLLLVIKMKLTIEDLNATIEACAQPLNERLGFMTMLACVIKDRWARAGSVHVSKKTWESLHPKFHLKLEPCKDGSMDVRLVEPLWDSSAVPTGGGRRVWTPPEA